MPDLNTLYRHTLSMLEVHKHEQCTTGLQAIKFTSPSGNLGFSLKDMFFIVHILKCTNYAKSHFLSQLLLVWMFLRWEFAIHYNFLLDIHTMYHFLHWKWECQKSKQWFYNLLKFTPTQIKDRRLVFFFEPQSYSFYWEE